MWDVIWTDPDKELVGEHRAKKGSRKGQEERQSIAASTRSRRTSTSAKSSLSSDLPFSFLSSKGLKSLRTNSSSRKGRLSFSSAISSTNDTSCSSQSPLFPDSQTKSNRSSGIAVPISIHSSETSPRTKLGEGAKSTRDGGSVRSSWRESVFSQRADSDVITCDSACEESLPSPNQGSHLVQTLGIDSYVTEETEVSAQKRSDLAQNPDKTTQVVISFGSKPQPIPTPPETPLLPACLNIKHSALPVRSSSFSKPPSPKDSIHTNHEQATSERWKPPDEWYCLPLELNVLPSSPTINYGAAKSIAASSAQEENKESGNWSLLRRDVERMAAAGPSVILSRLNEVWNLEPNTILQQEIMKEKKRWMLSALYRLEVIEKGNVGSGVKIPLAQAKRILALYKSEIIAAYLAALHPSKTLFHVAAEPLSAELFPNVHPLCIPAASPLAYPLAVESVEAVYASSLPSQFASSDIPMVLKNVSRSLREGGTFQCIIIDVHPYAMTLGHHLRTWLDKHVVVNLEKDHRCINPCRLFPGWLASASLRGEGSLMATTKFLAVKDSVLVREQDPDPIIRKTMNEKLVKAELCTLVGRMLWMEVWGKYVTAETWWWDDELCIKECIELGTFWEYRRIEGVKQS